MASPQKTTGALEGARRSLDFLSAHARFTFTGCLLNTTGSGRGPVALAQLAHRDGGVGHAVGEAPLVVVPGDDADEGAAQDLGLVDAKGRRVRVMVEVGRDH